MPANLFVITVGVGGREPDSLLHALVHAIGHCGASDVGLIFSGGSRSMAEDVREKLDGRYAFHELCVTDADHVDRCFMEIVDFLTERAAALGCPPSQTRVNFTSGTKPMSAAAALAAVAFGVETLDYIGGEREHGVVQKGLEDIKTFSAARCRAHQHLQTAIGNLEALRFSAATDLLNNIQPVALSERGRKVNVCLLQLARAYHEWDLFGAGLALEKFQNINDVPEELKRFELPKEIFDHLAKVRASINRTAGGGGNAPEFGINLLAELWNNAQRRMFEGKYDDACARFYRLTEMCAQHCLEKRGIDTSKVREDQVPERFRTKITFERDSKQPNRPATAKLGLDKAYGLLEAFDDPIGKAYWEEKQLRNSMKVRNQSILAHGVTPVEGATCKIIAERLMILLNQAIPGFGETARNTQFPWLSRQCRSAP